MLRRALPAVLIESDFDAVSEAVFELGAATQPVDIDAATADVAALIEPLRRSGSATSATASC